MDSEILQALTDCKAVLDDRDGKIKHCRWWYDIIGECRKPANIDCPEGVKPPQQEFMDNEYIILGA